MIAVKLFTDPRVWHKKYDQKKVKKRVYLWDNSGRFVDKKNLERGSNKRTVGFNKRHMVHHRPMMTNDFDEGRFAYCNVCTEAQFCVMIDVHTSQCLEKSELIFKVKRNRHGHIICRSYVCFLSVLLKNLVERLNNENFNIYENDESDEGGSLIVGDPQWQVISTQKTVSEAFIRNHFYLVLTSKNQTTSLPSKDNPIKGMINNSDVNRIVDLRDGAPICIDVRDDQEIHLRPLDIYLPLDIVFAGDNGFDRLCVSALPASQTALIKMEETNLGRVFYIKLQALNQSIDIQHSLQQLCHWLALPNWYDYDFCLGKRGQDETDDNLIHCDTVHLWWHSGVRSSLMRVLDKWPLVMREWTWLASEARIANCLGNIDFFYWNLLFLRKRLCLYKNPLNDVHFRLSDFVAMYPIRDLCGNLLDLCFDCWRFTHNLGEIMYVLSRCKKKTDKKTAIKEETMLLLRSFNYMINNQTEKQADKPDMDKLTDYLRHVMECFLLRINSSFISMREQQTATRICLHTIFNDIDKKEPFYHNTLLRLARQCWLNVCCSVRMIESIKDNAHDKLQHNLSNIDFTRGLTQAITQQISVNKLLFFSGLSNFNLNCLLLINRQFHLGILLQNGERLLAFPFDRTHKCLNDQVCARLYLKSTNIKLTKEGLSSHRFVSALDKIAPKLNVDKPVVEKVFKQPVLIKSVAKKNFLPKRFSTTKVEYIVINTDQTSDIGCHCRDSFFKCIQIIDDTIASHSVALTVEDPDGCYDYRSQLEVLFDDIEAVNLRKRFNYEFKANDTIEQPNVPAKKLHSTTPDWYQVPTSEKTVDQPFPVPPSPGLSMSEAQPSPGVSSTVFSVQPVTMDETGDVADELAQISKKMRTSRLEQLKIASHKRFLDYFKNLYSTLHYIVKLLIIDGIGEGEQASEYYRLQRLCLYLIQNHDKICCQKIILQNSIQLLDDITCMSMQLASQGKYNTHETVRQLLMGAVKTAD